MAVTLRGNKGSALTHAEMDANFTDFMTLSGTGASRTITSINAPDFNSTSDIRLKENLQPIPNCDYLYKINSYSFNFKFDDNKRRKYGLIAQDLAQVFPEVVSTSEDGYLRVNYDALVPVVIELLKSQKNDIETLKREVDDLKRQLGK